MVLDEATGTHFARSAGCCAEGAGPQRSHTGRVLSSETQLVRTPEGVSLCWRPPSSRTTKANGQARRPVCSSPVIKRTTGPQVQPQGLGLYSLRGSCISIHFKGQFLGGMLLPLFPSSRVVFLCSTFLQVGKWCSWHLCFHLSKSCFNVSFFRLRHWSSEFLPENYFKKKYINPGGLWYEWQPFKYRDFVQCTTRPMFTAAPHQFSSQVWATPFLILKVHFFATDVWSMPS